MIKLYLLNCFRNDYHFFLRFPHFLYCQHIGEEYADQAELLPGICHALDAEILSLSYDTYKSDRKQNKLMFFGEFRECDFQESNHSESS
jgi:hypothetical protein